MRIKHVIDSLLDSYGRLFERGAGGDILQVESLIAAAHPGLVALRLLEAADEGGIAAGTLVGPARGRCLWAREDGSFSLLIPLAKTDVDLQYLWLRALARDSAGRLLPPTKISVVPPAPLLPGEEERIVTIGQYAHQPDSPFLKPAAWRQLELRLKLAATAPLLARLTTVAPIAPLARGRPLSAWISPSDYPLLFDLLGGYAAAEDLSLLAGHHFTLLGLEESAVEAFRAAGLLLPPTCH